MSVLNDRINLGPAELVPFFWRVLRSKSNDVESLALKTGRKHMEDIYFMLEQRYASLSIRSCPAHVRSLFHIIPLRRPIAVEADFWDHLNTRTTSFLVNRFFVRPEENNFSLLTPMTNIEAMSEDFKAERILFSKEEGSYFIHGEKVYFNEDPWNKIDPSNVVINTLRLPTGHILEYEETYLYGQQVSFRESPVRTHYADLVLSDDDASFWEACTADFAEFINGLFRVMYSGATAFSIQLLVNLAMGSPTTGPNNERVLTLTNETIEGVDYRVITTTGNVYHIASPVQEAPWVTVGAILKPYTPVAHFIAVNEYPVNPEWIDGQEFGTSGRLVDYDAGTDTVVNYDLVTNYTLEEVNDPETGIPYEARPRMDLSLPVERIQVSSDPLAFEYRIPNGTASLWHNVVGPCALGLEALTSDITEDIIARLHVLLRELIPVHVILDFKKLSAWITILSINNDEPVELVGSYLPGVEYFLSTEETIVPFGHPDATSTYIGVGTFFGFLDTSPKPFKATFMVTSTTGRPDNVVTLPLVQGEYLGEENELLYTYDFDIDWGDGSPVQHISSYDDDNKTHTYESVGEFHITVTGTMQMWRYYDPITEENSGTSHSLVSIDQAGAGFGIGVRYFAGAFYGCFRLKNVASFYTHEGIDFTQMFYRCDILNQVGLLDTSNGIYFKSMFGGSMNIETIEVLDTSSGINFENMFAKCMNLHSITLTDVSGGDALDKYKFMFDNCYALEHLHMNNANEDLSVRHSSDLSVAARNKIMEDLAEVGPPGSNIKEIYLPEPNIGEDDDIAINKGWNVPRK